MFQGITYALSACCIWGLIYVVPQFMTGFSSFEVVLGCYLFYGAVSSLMFAKSLYKGIRYPKSIWMNALILSLVSTIVYYTFVVLALRYSSPAMCTLILGISPITIAFYSNWQQREICFKSLVVPSILILLGLAIINVPYLEATVSVHDYLLGLIFSFCALVSWTWYVVANSRFLKEHPQVRSGNWTTLVGVATLFWVVVFALIIGIFFNDQLKVEKYITWNEELIRFLIGSAILGYICSWLGAYLWNKAATRLPVFLAGQLTVFETIFGVTFVYFVSWQYPTPLESLGIITLLSAVLYGIRRFAQKKAYVLQLNPH